MRKLDYKRSCDGCGKQARCWTWMIEETREPVFYCNKCKKELSQNQRKAK